VRFPLGDSAVCHCEIDPARWSVRGNPRTLANVNIR
jgi:hypothetical protein